MNDLSAITAAIAEGAPTLVPDLEIAIPLDDARTVRVLRNPLRAGLVVSVAQRVAGRSEAGQADAREALLRLGADTRWTSGLAGALDADGTERICLAVDEPVDAPSLERALAAALQRLAGLAGTAPAPTSAAASAFDVPPAWLRA